MKNRELNAEQQWKRNLAILWIAQFFAMAGMSSVVPFLPLFIRELGVKSIEENAMWSGLIFSGPFLISFFITPLWGNLGDKYGKKVMALRAIAGLALANILMSFSQDVYQLFTFRILQGLLSGFYPASIALAAAISPKEKTGYAIGIIQSANTAGNIIGPLIGGIISDLFGFRNVFLIVGTIIFVNGILLWIFIREERAETQQQNYNLTENWKYFIKKFSLLKTSILILISSFAVAMIRPIFVLYVESFNIGESFLPTITGILYSIIGIFSTLSSFYFGKKIGDGTGEKMLILFSTLCGVMYMLHSFIFDIYFLIPVRIFLGLGYGVIVPILFTRMNSLTEKERQGGMLGIASSFQILGNLAGPVSAGFLVSMIGLRIPFTIAGALFILIAVIAFASKSKMKR